jgi:hypothetical protein
MATVKLDGKTNQFTFDGQTYKANRVNDSIGGESDEYTLEGVEREGELRNNNGDIYGHWFSLKSMTDAHGAAHHHNYTFEAYFA